MGSPAIDFQPEEQQVDFQEEGPAIEAGSLPPEVRSAIQGVPRPAIPAGLTGPPRPTVPPLVQTSPYMPGAVPRFEPLAGTETPQSAETARLTNEAAQAGAEQGSGVGGYPKIVAGAKKIAETGIAPGSSYYTPPQHIPTSEERRAAASGAAELISGVGEASTPLIAESVGARPIATALGFGAGYGASKGAGALAHGHVSPETEELIRQAGFWAPGLAVPALGLRGEGVETPDVRARGVCA